MTDIKLDLGARDGALFDTWTDANWHEHGFFKRSELECHHCKKLHIDRMALYRLNWVRSALNRPVILYSAYRCPTHNLDVGGAPHSFHLSGMAFDIEADTFAARMEIITTAAKQGFTGFGVYRSFVHCDIGPVRYWKG